MRAMMRHLRPLGMYRLLAFSVLAATLSLGGLSTVSASAPTNITFTQTVTSDEFISSRPAGGNTFFVDVAEGDYVGLGSYRETDYFLLHADGTGVFHGVATCVCIIEGRTGTITIRYTGTLAADGTFVSPFVIVRGTGDLTGIHGTGVTTGTFTGVFPVAYTDVLQYHFAP